MTVNKLFYHNLRRRRTNEDTSLTHAPMTDAYLRNTLSTLYTVCNASDWSVVLLWLATF